MYIILRAYFELYLKKKMVFLFLFYCILLFCLCFLCFFFLSFVLSCKKKILYGCKKKQKTVLTRYVLHHRYISQYILFCLCMH